MFTDGADFCYYACIHSAYSMSEWSTKQGFLKEWPSYLFIYAEVIFVQFMTLQEKKILASIIEIQKENWE